MLDALLPAVLAANPPLEVEVNQPKICLSPNFQKRYVPPSPPATSSEEEATIRVSSYWTSSLLAEPKISTEQYRRSSRFLPKEIVERNARLKLRRTLQRLKVERLPGSLSQVENIASILLSKTLRYQKLLERQEVTRRRRRELDTLRKSVLQRAQVKEAAELGENTQLISQATMLMASPLLRDTKKERYRDRVLKKHQSTANAWDQRANLIRLSAPIGRKVSTIYSKLIMAHNLPRPHGVSLAD